MSNSEKRSKAEMAQEVSKILKGTQPGGVGKTPAPFKSQTKQSEATAKSARDVSTAIAQGVLDQNHSDAQMVSFVNPTPVSPRADIQDDAVKPDLLNQDFPLAATPDGKPAMEHHPSGEYIEKSSATSRFYTWDDVEAESEAANSKSGFNHDQMITDAAVWGDLMDIEPWVADEVAPNEREGDGDYSLETFTAGLTQSEEGMRWDYGDPDDVSTKIQTEVNEGLASGDSSSLMSEGVTDTLAMGDVGEEAQQGAGFDLIPEANAGTPFAGLPDAVPAPNAKDSEEFMQKEGAPDHVPNAETVEMVDGLATEAGEFAEAMVDVVERLAEKLQAAMVRLRNLEATLERLV